MNPPNLDPLKPGEIALRFKVALLPPAPLDVSNPTYRPPRMRVVGLQAVEVIKQTGDIVAWTNHLPARKNGSPSERFYSFSYRLELISLEAIENLCTAPAENPTVPNTVTPE